MLFLDDIGSLYYRLGEQKWKKKKRLGSLTKAVWSAILIDIYWSRFEPANTTRKNWKLPGKAISFSLVSMARASDLRLSLELIHQRAWPFIFFFVASVYGFVECVSWTCTRASLQSPPAANVVTFRPASLHKYFLGASYSLPLQRKSGMLLKWNEISWHLFSLPRFYQSGTLVGHWRFLFFYCCSPIVFSQQCRDWSGFPRARVGCFDLLRITRGKKEPADNGMCVKFKGNGALNLRLRVQHCVSSLVQRSLSFRGVSFFNMRVAKMYLNF